MSTIKNLIKSASSASELRALLKFKMSEVPNQDAINLEFSALAKSDIDFCFDALTKVSRSFAIVIQQLPVELKEAVGIFYLVLRGLDTVEDDMNLDEIEKEKMLRSFYKYCYLTDFRLNGIGDTADYQLLLENFDKVTRSFLNLKEEYKDVIADICFRMGNGMADSISYKIQTVKDYDIYCHYVAGLVGQGLSELFAASGFEDESLVEEMAKANSMGLFLQKTNITRDYLEDFDAGRVFWPEEIWKQFHEELSFYKLIPESANSLKGLNYMVKDAIRHLPDCINYLKLLKNEEVFRFCAIPQLMAVATLVELYDNVEVFNRNVKIRKGLSARILMETKNVDTVIIMLCQFIEELSDKMQRSNNTPADMWQSIHEIKIALGYKLDNPIIF